MNQQGTCSTQAATNALTIAETGVGLHGGRMRAFAGTEEPDVTLEPPQVVPDVGSEFRVEFRRQSTQCVRVGCKRERIVATLLGELREVLARDGVAVPVTQLTTALRCRRPRGTRRVMRVQ